MHLNDSSTARCPSAKVCSLFIAFLIFSTLSVLHAQGLTPEQVASLESVSSSIISDDGNTIAYTVSVPADPYEENVGSSTELHVLDVQSGQSKPYYSVSSIGGIEFRPNHNTITFLTSRPDDENRSLYELPLNGGEAVKIFEFKRSISSYTWHNDGDHIAFSSFNEPEESDTPLPYEADVYEENNPQRPAYITNVNQDQEPDQIQADGTVYMMEWSPDGSKIAVSAAPTPNVDDYYMAQQVFVVDFPSGEVSAEINNEGKTGQIEWSPDGERIAILAGSDINDPIDGRILTVSAEGGTPEIIDEEYEGMYEQIEWAANNEIHFLASESTASVFGTIRPNGSDKQTLFRSEDHSIGSFTRSGNGVIAFTGSTPDHPNELFVLRDGQAEKMTTHNEWLSDVDLGRQEVMTYTARDGEFEIDGIMIYPVDYSEGARIPVITMVHGGPELHYDNGWLTSYSVPGQMAAAKGYGVFYPNYRGSTGRGIEFATSTRSTFPAKSSMIL